MVGPSPPENGIHAGSPISVHNHSPVRRRSSNDSASLEDPARPASHSPTLIRSFNPNDPEVRERQRTMDVDMAMQLSRARRETNASLPFETHPPSSLHHQLQERSRSPERDAFPAMLDEEDEMLYDHEGAGRLDLRGMNMDGEVLSSQAPNQQGNIEFFNAAQQLSIGTVTTTIVSGNCTYHVTVVNNNNYGNSPSTEGAEVPLEEIVAWLKGPKFLRIYEEALGQRLSNTGVWFIESEEFRQLVEGKDVVVWGTGMPGAGKTVISSFSLERLKEIFKGQEGVGIVGAYIRYTERPPTRAIFAGLLSQLVKDHPCAYHYMRHIYIQKDRGDLSDLDMVKAFQDIVGLLSKVFLIIDGLDEADDGVKDDLLRALPSLGANVLITSRPLELYSPRLPHALHVSIEARTEDIDHFVEEKIKSSSKLQAILRGKLALTEMLKARIRESSRGMFLVARLQMDGVLEKGRSVSSLLKALNQLPSGVEEMYKNTLDRINAQVAEDVSIAHRVFIWLLHSARDLLAHELQDALAISFEDETYDSIDIIPVSMILSMCGGFVTVEEQGEKVIGSEYGSESHLRYIHYTTHEFLKTIELPEFASPHVYIAVACLIYLRQHTQRLQAWEKEEDPKTLRSYFASNPFLSYADQHWGKHASISQYSGPLHPLIQSYLAGCTRHELVNHKFSLASADTLGPSIRATALHLAAMYGLVDAITSKALPYLPLPQDLGGETPFHYAARFNQPPALEALLASYSGVNDLDKDGKTALMTACQHGHEDCVRTFMAAHEVKVELRDQHGRSAFWYACTCDNDTIPSLLLSSCARLDVDVCDDDGNTAFAKACNSGLARTVGGVLHRTQLTSTKLLSEIGGEAALAKVLENHCAGQSEKEWSEEDRTALNTILDFLSSHESVMQAIDSEPEESDVSGSDTDEEPPSVVVEPRDEPDQQQQRLMRPGQGPQGLMAPGNGQVSAPHMAGLNPQMGHPFAPGMPQAQGQNPALRRLPSQTQMGMNNGVVSGGMSLPQS